MEIATPTLAAPTWKNSLGSGWSTMINQFLLLFLVVMILSVLDIPLELFGSQKVAGGRGLTGLEVLAFAYWLLLLSPIEYSADWLFVQAVRRERTGIRSITTGFSNYLDTVLARLLVTSLIVLAMLAMLIPGIIVACRLAFVSYLVIDKRLDPVAAVEASWKMTRGHTWKIFALGFTAIFIFLGGLLLFFVGVFPALMWIKASFASLYQAVLEETDENIFIPADNSGN